MFILASKSPRRKELMKLIVSSFQIVSEEIDEESSYDLSPIEATKDISRRKAEVVADKYPNEIIIGADTIVVIDNKIIGKPKDEADAIRILKLLSNRTHEVITGYTIIANGNKTTKSTISKVTFNKLEDTLISDYVATKSPLDKAGAYGVQDNKKYHLINNVEGDINNVIGFPVDDIKQTLIELKLL